MNANEEDLLGKPLDEVPKREPDYDCNARKSDSDGNFEGYCGARAGKGTDHVGEGRCQNHGGAGGEGGGAPEGNQNAAKHGAYSESFVEDFLSDDEIERVEQAQEILATPEGAQDHGRLMAAIAAEQFRKSGDDRFLRRYESICDKFGIAPADELEVNGELDGTVSGELAVDITHHRVPPDEPDDEPEQ